MSTALHEPAISASGPPIPEIASSTSAPADGLYRLSIAQYHAMAEAGILRARDRVVLLEGLLVAKMTKYPPHILATGLAQDALTGAIPGGWHVSVQDPVTIAEAQSEPEPDVKVVRGNRRDYGDRRVVPADVALVVEVADSSVRLDQTKSKALYALATIPFYWIVNIPANRLEVYSDPTGPGPTPGYLNHQNLGPNDSVQLILDGTEVARIAVRDLLP